MHLGDGQKIDHLCFSRESEFFFRRLSSVSADVSRSLINDEVFEEEGRVDGRSLIILNKNKIINHKP